jgi:hypothetical protein
LSSLDLIPFILYMFVHNLYNTHVWDKAIFQAIRDAGFRSLQLSTLSGSTFIDSKKKKKLGNQLGQFATLVHLLDDI